MGAKRHHGFNGDDHAAVQDKSGAAGLEIRHFRLFVHLRADAVAHKTAHHAKTGGLHILLDGGADGVDVIARPRLLDAHIEALLGHAHEAPGLVAHPPHRIGARCVPHKTLKNHAHVHADDVPLVQGARRGETVHHLLVDRAAGGKGIAVIPKKSGLDLVIGAHVARKLFKLLRGDAGGHEIAHGIQDVGHHAVRFPQAGHFPLVLDIGSVILFHCGYRQARPLLRAFCIRPWYWLEIMWDSTWFMKSMATPTRMSRLVPPK